MAAFQFTAIDPMGKEKKGVTEGDSAKLVRLQLRQQGLIPLEVRPIKQIKKNRFSRQHAMSQSDLTLFTRQLATLLNAGIPLENALSACAEQTEKDRVRQIILSVRSRVLEGHSLATGLRDFSQSFSNLYSATIAAGEDSGKLDQILEQLADYIEKQQAIKQKIQQAMIYPAIMTLVSITIVIFLMTYVVPKMIQVFTSAEQTLPFMTEILIGFSQGLTTYGLPILILLLGSIALFHYFLRKHLALRRKMHALLLRLPVIGRFIKIVHTARFSRTLGILSSAGISILDAMTTASNLVSNIPIHEALRKATENVREGAPIHRALRQTHYFPPMSLHLISSGESSGQLEAMLLRASNNQDNEVKSQIDTLLTLFEPLLILIMGAIVLFIVLAILLPIFSLNQFTG